MVTSLEIRDLVMDSRDACVCGPLNQCRHQREQRNMTMRQWLTNVKSISHVQNKQGSVYVCQIQQQPCAVKHFNRKNLWGHSRRESLSGDAVNRLRLPWFVESLGTFYRNSGPYNITTFVDGTLMKHSPLTRQQFVSITAQLCVALEMAQRDFYFGHYDLHLENIILSYRKPDRHMIFEEYMIHFNDDVCPVVIDFGMSCGSHQSTSWGLRGLESKGIYPKLRTGYDMFCFLLYCQQEYGSSDLIDLVDYILRNFFRHDGTKHYLRALHDFAAWQTPKQLFDFLVERGLLSATRVYSRNVYRFPSTETTISPKKKFSPNAFDYYIDYLYDNRPFEGKVDVAIRDDIHRLMIETNILVLMEKYYKIIECQATGVYKFWVKRFVPILNKYWVSKTRYHAKKRKQLWL